MEFDSSLLSLLTTPTSNGEEIFFAYRKEVRERPPDEITWYRDRGDKGIAKSLWKDKNIKQWLLIGNDMEVHKIWDSLLSTKRYTITWDDVEVDFSLPELDMVPETQEDNFRKIAGIKVINPIPVLYRRQDYPAQVDFLIDEKSNCSFIQGYLYHPSISPMAPAGLLPEDSLFNYLKDKVVAVYQPRGFYYDLRETSGSEGNTIVEGFIQHTKVFRETHLVEIRTLDGAKTLGRSSIDITSGKWQVPIGPKEGQGQFLIVNRSDEAITSGEKYYLIGNINITPNIVDTVFTDLYGRRVYLTGEHHGNKYEPIESIRWDASVHPDSNQAEIELSDRITHVLLSLGSDVVINDPFLLGDILEKDGQVKFTSQSQIIFVNALMNAMARGIIKNITLVGYWAKARRFVAGDQKIFLDNYKMLAKFLQSIFAKVPKAKLESFKLVLSNQTFHDRYWISGGLGTQVCYQVTNSTNGPFEQNELSIRQQNELDSFKERTKISRRIQEGTVINLI